MRCLMLFQSPTQLYVTVTYIMPYLLSDYGPWTLYVACVVCWFVVINLFANWFAVMLYDPSFPKTKDNPYFDTNLRTDNPPDTFRPLIQEATSNNHQNGSVVYDMAVKDALPWSYCKYCERNVPPRAYHCKFCKRCILKRDHHCFMVGNCVGFNNQRYFFMLLFYGMVYESLGFVVTYKYLSEVYWPMAINWKDFVFPVAVWRWLFGAIEGRFCLMIVQITIETIFSLVALVYFASQVKMTSSGITLYEMAKKVPIRNTNGFKRNFRSVFGDFWYLNFFFPLTPIFRQMDDGIRWEGVKYDNNAYQKWKDDGELL